MTAFDSKAYLDKVDAFWRAANFISVGQLYLKDNPLLQRTNEAAVGHLQPIGH